MKQFVNRVGAVWTSILCNCLGAWFSVLVLTGFAAAAVELPPAANKLLYRVSLHLHGKRPFTITVASGSLPNGLSVSPTGVISGHPIITADTDFTFTLNVQDSSTPPRTTPLEYHLLGTVNPPRGDRGDSCEGETGDDELYSDCRGVFDASFYVGLAIDTFAGSDTLHYLDPSATTGQIRERGIGGFDFAYRLLGDKTPMVGEYYQHRSLWIYGETVHGVRSADVNCTDHQDLPICTANPTIPSNPGGQLYYILRNATSLEGYTGLRYEFWNLQRDSASPANLYFKAQAGLLKVAGAPGSILAMHHLALGAVATKGKLQDSYLEVGWGRSDTFVTAKHNRLKIDGYLQWKLPSKLGDVGLSGFAQLLVDTHFKLFQGGSDAIQTYIGVNYDLDKLFGIAKKD